MPLDCWIGFVHNYFAFWFRDHKRPIFENAAEKYSRVRCQGFLYQWPDNSENAGNSGTAGPAALSCRLTPGRSFCRFGIQPEKLLRLRSRKTRGQHRPLRGRLRLCILIALRAERVGKKLSPVGNSQIALSPGRRQPCRISQCRLILRPKCFPPCRKPARKPSGVHIRLFCWTICRKSGLTTAGRSACAR